MLSDLLRIRGNGCAGSSPSGDSTGMISSRKYSRSQRVCFAFQRVAREHAHAGLVQRRAQRRRSSSRTARRPARAARSWMRVSTVAGGRPSGPRRHAEVLRVAHGGGADLEELVEVGAGDAQVAQALEQRHLRVLRLRQHAEVEVELRQLAVEVQRAGRAADRRRRRVDAAAFGRRRSCRRSAWRARIGRRRSRGARARRRSGRRTCCRGRLRCRSPAAPGAGCSTCLTIDRPRPVPPLSRERLVETR